jgi:methylthioribulose-1-phosphate dehydratase
MASYPAEHPRNLIPELCRLFYSNGWVTGTGGGISMRDRETGHVFVAPSGVQKERVQPDDLFVLSDKDGSLIERPRSDRGASYKQSDCTPLFFNAFRLRDAASCMHTHSQAAVLATMLTKGSEFRISHVEMVKGIINGKTGKAHLYEDTLVVPIIENTNFECDLTSSMAEAMEKYPEAHCVLVRRHGAYIWGPTWEKTKTMAECYDYLFSLAVDMTKLGLPLVGGPAAVDDNKA